MLSKREKFFKHILNDHVFSDGIDSDGWYWYGETKYKAFGGDEEVLVEISDANHDQYACSYKSYEDLFRYGWSDMFEDWLLNYDFYDEEYWAITLSDVMKLKKYGYLNGCLGKTFIDGLIEDLMSKEDSNEL